MEIQKIYSEIDTEERLYSVLMTEEEYRLFSKENDNINPALAVAGSGTALTLGTIGASNFKFNNAAKKKLDKYKNRIVDEDVEAVKQKTKENLQKGRRIYKDTLRETRKGIKSAKQDLNASYDRAAEAIKNGANEVTVGTKMNLPTGQKYIQKETMGYGFQNNSQRNKASEALKDQFSHDVNNNTINRQTKNTISDLKFHHQRSQKNIVESGKKEIDQIYEKFKSAGYNKDERIIKRKQSLQKAAKKLKRAKGLKIGTVGLVGTGLATAGALAYKKQKTHE